ncbi:phage terminase Nu1 subunit (DNA packaging protein) [Hoeflea halophila]|uniref:Phage terminase Nu1 subunit (DNA packaging protein) n=1 Tax=Hoeflea halophila TaxID=714899 RepID=A0A286IFC4_9HYPH|nr:hypothetical protein [Hoeflea halophila]SOE18845.1 phage terminase Nu1 subunit (DNA packaging protein) [Hoeflea halophila]
MPRITPDGQSTIGPGALAILLGISEAKIRDLNGRGIITRPEGAREYPMIAAVNEYTAHIREQAAGRNLPEEMMTAKLAKAKADAAKAQMIAARMQGTLIFADKIETRWNAAGRVIRASMLSLSSRLAQRLNLGPEAAAIVKEEIVEALTALADNGADQAHAEEVREAVENARSD